MPMILCLKIVHGVVTETAIDTTAIKGMQESVKPVNGVNQKCTKVYASAGHFYVFATPKQLHGAKQAAELSGQDVHLLPNTHHVMPQPKKQFIPNKYKMLGKGK